MGGLINFFKDFPYLISQSKFALESNDEGKLSVIKPMKTEKSEMRYGKSDEGSF